MDSDTLAPPYALQIEVVRLLHHIGLDLPEYATPGAACLDLVAALPLDADGYALPVMLRPGEAAAIPTGLRMAIPVGWCLDIRSRSGLSLSRGIVVANSPGTIDADYRGEVLVILRNLGRESYAVERGQRIAQAMIVPAWRLMWREVHTLDSTERGDGGLGSTGI